MTLGYATATRNAFCTTLGTLADAGAGGATVKVYSGTRPVNANTAPGGGNTLLLTFTLATTALDAPNTGVTAIAGLPISAVGAANGTAAWWRMADSTGATVIDGDAGADGSGADLELSTTSITTGLTVNLTTGTFTQPA
jgi:hypothetical protein